MPFAILLMSVLFLNGCAVAKWKQEGKTLTDAEQDVFVCENTILVEHGGLGSLTDEEMDMLLDKCMKENGYHKR